MSPNSDNKELATIVERLLNQAAQERKKELLKKRMESDDFIRDVHEAHIGIDPSSFEVVSRQETDDGHTLIEWTAIEYVTTEFTLDEPYKFKLSGKLLIRTDGTAELIHVLSK